MEETCEVRVVGGKTRSRAKRVPRKQATLAASGGNSIPAETSSVPAIRVRGANDREVRADGDFVLYWMTASRRVEHNFGLQRAVDWAMSLQRPLLILEALRTGHPWASDRLHRFVMRGMIDNLEATDGSPAGYYPYLEPEDGAGRGLLETLGMRAAVIVTDDFPCYFLPRMLAAAAPRVTVRMEAVDSNGLYPMHATERVFSRAFDFRRHLQKVLADHLGEDPRPFPLAEPGLAPFAIDLADLFERWRPADRAALGGPLDGLPIDHSVLAVDGEGGRIHALRRLDRFLAKGLQRYGERNRPELDVTSGLSPYLHFGHVSAHEIFRAVASSEGWTPLRLSTESSGSRSGWWGMSEEAEGFLDQLVTWRELGYNYCAHRSDYAEYDSLPDWARTTLDEHRSDERPWLYDVEALDGADTHDELWNAAQRQLRREGRIHNYMRMVWGKKILEWSRTPELAFETMIRLNDRYALDGRNPNSYSGMGWVLGRYDRPWGPERPIYGKIRYMSSANTARKLPMKGYMERYGP